MFFQVYIKYENGQAIKTNEKYKDGRKEMRIVICDYMIGDDFDIGAKIGIWEENGRMGYQYFDKIACNMPGDAYTGVDEGTLNRFTEYIIKRINKGEYREFIDHYLKN